MLLIFCVPAMVQTHVEIPKLQKDMLQLFAEMNKEYSAAEQQYIKNNWTREDEDLVQRFENAYRSDVGKRIDAGFARLGIKRYETRMFYAYDLYRNWLVTGKVEIMEHLVDRFAPPPAPLPH